MKLFDSHIELRPDGSTIRSPIRLIGELLVEAGRLKPEHIERITAAQKKHRTRFGEAGVKLGLITESEVRLALSSQYGCNYLLPGQGNFSEELIAAYQPFTAQTEALHKLRTELLVRWFNPNRRLLALVSTAPGDGRSYLAANLAVAFAQLGETTLLVDGNMRAPRLHKIFNCDDSVGLSTILSGRTSSFREAIAPVPALQGLQILPAGAIPPNPLELLSQSTFVLLLAYLAERYDAVIFDTPASSVHADAQVIAARAGGALMLARRDRTRAADLKKLSDAFSASGTPVVGTIMNHK